MYVVYLVYTYNRALIRSSQSAVWTNERIRVVITCLQEATPKQQVSHQLLASVLLTAPLPDLYENAEM